jgi:F0F1-type ATP synthase alpha subunit
VGIFLLAGKSGFVYDFLIYQGASTEIKKIYQAFGSGAATVMQLVERLKANQTGRYALYFDNYFSTYNLFQYLESKGIMAIGTLRINRFQNPPLKSDKQMKREGRASCDSTVSNDGIVV